MELNLGTQDEERKENSNSEGKGERKKLNGLKGCNGEGYGWRNNCRSEKGRKRRRRGSNSGREKER